MTLVVDAYSDRLAEMFTQIDHAVADLPTQALDWVPGSQMNSLAVLTAHVCGSTRYWIGDVGLGQPSQRDRDSEFRTQGLDQLALRAELARTLGWCRDAIDGLSASDLEAERHSERQDRPLTVAWALFHALEHAGLHAGHAQLTRQLWDQLQDTGTDETIGVP